MFAFIEAPKRTRVFGNSCSVLQFYSCLFPLPLSASSRSASQGPDTSAKCAPHLLAHARTPPDLLLPLAAAIPEEQERESPPPAPPQKHSRQRCPAPSAPAPRQRGAGHPWRRQVGTAGPAGHTQWAARPAQRGSERRRPRSALRCPALPCAALRCPARASCACRRHRRLCLLPSLPQRGNSSSFFKFFFDFFFFYLKFVRNLFSVSRKNIRKRIQQNLHN